LPPSFGDGDGELLLVEVGDPLLRPADLDLLRRIAMKQAASDKRVSDVLSRSRQVVEVEGSDNARSIAESNARTARRFSRCTTDQWRLRRRLRLGTRYSSTRVSVEREEGLAGIGEEAKDRRVHPVGASRNNPGRGLI